MLEAAVEAGAPEGIIGWIDAPARDMTRHLMEQSDLILATGGPNMVKAAYSSGTPAVGVGAGNTPAVIDESADIILAVNSIVHSKVFDNGMICASEQAVIVPDSIYDAVKAEFIKRGCWFLSPEEKEKVGGTVIVDGSVNAGIVGKPAPYIAALAGVDVPQHTKILIGEADAIDLSEPFAHEKLSPVLGMYRANSFDDAVAKAEALIALGGKGHTSGIYLNTATAQKRLDAIREFTEFGSGFRIAMRDLELRGAGNLLGPQQSGHLANIGYDLYCKLLEEAVLEAQGEAPKPNRDVETRMDVHVNAYLPAEYVTGDKQRLEVYKRIASITTAAQRDDVEEELVDRFGDEPLCVANLVAVAYLKAMCAKLGIDRVNQADGRIDMRFALNAQVDGQKLFTALNGFDKRLTLNAAPPVTLTLRDQTLNREDLLMLCVKVMERLLARMELSAA